MTTKNSDLVANLEASPQVANDAQELHGVIRVAQGNVALAAGDTGNADIVMLAPIPSTLVSTQMPVALRTLTSLPLLLPMVQDWQSFVTRLLT